MSSGNFYLVDCENVSIQTLVSCVIDSPVKQNATLILFCNKKVSLVKRELDTLEVIFESVLFELIDVQGKNALDSYLSVSLGLLAATRKDSHFSVVSNDRGFLHTLLPLRAHASANHYRLMAVKNNKLVNIS